MRSHLLAASLLPLLGGCVDRLLIRAEDVPAHNALVLETVDEYPSLKRVRQFWLCHDEGARLVCSRQCGGSQDLACHTISYTSGPNLR